MADPSKTETATPRRREEARKRGQVAKSNELNTALGILGSLMVLHFAGSHLFQQVASTARYFWGELGRPELAMPMIERLSPLFFRADTGNRGPVTASIRYLPIAAPNI